ncbi:MaoC family dehydratase [bacterium]|nr:MaoC family dehydratase [bacterium]
MADYTQYAFGRRLDDFREGEIFRHPWEVTIDDGVLAFCAASFFETSPLYTSDPFAKALGFKGRVVSPLVLLNFGLSFSVLDVSEQAIAHLAYIDVHFPNPAYCGDTVSAASEVLGTKLAGSGDKGTVHVRTTLWNQDRLPVCMFERMALVPAGAVENSPRRAWSGSPPETDRRNPAQIDKLKPAGEKTRVNLTGYLEDFEKGRVFVSSIGRTVGASEHMQLTTLFRNTHPLHFDANYCETNSFTKDRVVYGGLVLAFTNAVIARETGGQVVWTDSFDSGAHPAPVLAGDTIRAAAKVTSVDEINEHLGRVQLRLVGVKNDDPAALIASGADLFAPERGKSEGKIKNKVVEIDKTLIVQRRGK